MANCSILTTASVIFPALVLMTGMSGSAVAAAKAQGLQTIPPGYHLVASESGVPAEALYSVSLAETSRKLPHGERPWPWTLNVAGKGYRYNTRQEAYDALMSFMRRYPLKHIDVGIAQVNLGWNGAYFSSYYEALEPYTNLRVAARILKSCYDSNPGSWIQAAGCYHHPAGGQPARTYKAIVKRKLATLDLSTPVSYSDSEFQVARIPVPQRHLLPQSRELQWVEPRESRQ
ncbi:transglycosylase SLT domain-containing protein [Salmonella enterica]|nr:transglycosylase SLT domain-containing protein [Salmonella enterica]